MKKVLFLTVALMLSLAMGASALTVSGPNEFPIVDEPYGPPWPPTSRIWKPTKPLCTTRK